MAPAAFTRCRTRGLSWLVLARNLLDENEPTSMRSCVSAKASSSVQPGDEGRGGA